MKKEDLHIIKKCIEGQQEAQRLLYDQYKVNWFMVCLRYGNDRSQAEDILQEGLIQIFKDLHQYDAQKSKFVTWSSRLIVHAALRYLKKYQWKHQFIALEEVENIINDSENIFDKLSARELTFLVQELPIGYRLVFNMYAIEGFKHKEISKLLGISEGTSKSQLSKARKVLKRKLEEQFKITSS